MRGLEQISTTAVPQPPLRPGMYPLWVNGSEEKAREDPRRRHQAIWAGNYSTPSLAQEGLERGGTGGW